MEDKVCIYTLKKAKEKTMKWIGYSPAALEVMTGVVSKPLSVYVEDDVAESIVDVELSKMKVRNKAFIGKYGAASNVFTLAAGKVLAGEPVENVLLVQDGDVDRDEMAQKNYANKLITGTESFRQDQKDEMLNLIRAFVPQDYKTPEENLRYMVLSLKREELSEEECEIYREVEGVRAVVDTHEWIDEVVSKVGGDRRIALYRICRLASKSPCWENYVIEIRKWLVQKCEELNLAGAC